MKISKGAAATVALLAGCSVAACGSQPTVTMHGTITAPSYYCWFKPAKSLAVVNVQSANLKVGRPLATETVSLGPGRVTTQQNLPGDAAAGVAHHCVFRFTAAGLPARMAGAGVSVRPAGTDMGVPTVWVPKSRMRAARITLP